MPSAPAQLEDHEQPGWVPEGPSLIPVPPSGAAGAPHSPPVRYSLSALVRLQLADGGDGLGLTAHDECQERPLVHWAQQLLALIKEGETRQLSACDSQFCRPQPGLPQARR